MDLGLRDCGGYRKRYGVFECPLCGKDFEARFGGVRSGNTTSCGCQRRGNLSHGGKGTRLYNTWCGIKARANCSPKDRHHRWYANVEIDPAWEADFSAFRSWALSAGYADNLVIDRIDSARHYEPSNCRWVTQSENARKAMQKRYE